MVLRSLWLCVLLPFSSGFFLFNTAEENAIKKLQSGFNAEFIGNASVEVMEGRCMTVDLSLPTSCPHHMVQAHITRTCSEYLEQVREREQLVQAAMATVLTTRASEIEDDTPPNTDPEMRRRRNVDTETVQLEEKEVDCISEQEMFIADLDFILKHKIFAGSLYGRFKEIEEVPEDMKHGGLKVKEVFCDRFPVQLLVCNHQTKKRETGKLFQLETKDNWLVQYSDQPEKALVVSNGTVYPVEGCQASQDDYKCEKVSDTICQLPEVSSCTSVVHWYWKWILAALTAVIIIVLISVCLCCCLCKK